MLYQILSLSLGFLAVLILLVGLRMLIRRGWFLVWLRASFGLSLLLLAGGIAFVAADIYSYRSLDHETRIAILSFKEIGQQRFQVQVSLMDEETRDFEVHGDLWQMDARLIRWKGALEALGLKTAYRLDRLSGRYLALEQERDGPRSVYDLQTSRRGFDLWMWLREQSWVPWVEAHYGAAVYMPMKDRAEYMVSISRRGLLARPLNSIAMEAVDHWD